MWWSHVKRIKYYFGVLIEILHAIIQAVNHYIFSTTEKNIRNEIVLITGSGRGLGRIHIAHPSELSVFNHVFVCQGQQMALLFAKRGAIVVLCDIDEAGNAQTAELLSKELPSMANNEKRIFAYTCDIGNRQEVRTLVEKIQKDVGEITMLVNNGW
jgi:short-subunit dehydrogenase involved in D-alanine esterification of teichoic acids